jgi:Uma2 family endonuclease
VPGAKLARLCALNHHSSMAKLATDRPMTFDAASKLDPDASRGEIERGEFISLTNSTWRHAFILINIGSLLRSYVRTHREWKVGGGDPGCKLEHDPDTLRGPDVGLVRRERLPTGKGAQGWLEGAPELVVEILGDSQTVAELLKKASEFLTAGARMVWLVEPDAERVLVITAESVTRVFGKNDMLDVSESFPGLAFPVADVFED